MSLLEMNKENIWISSEYIGFIRLSSVLIFMFYFNIAFLHLNFVVSFWILKQFRLLLKYLKTPSEKFKREYNLLGLFSFPVWISLYLFLIMNLSVYSTYLFFCLNIKKVIRTLKPILKENKVPYNMSFTQ